MKKLLVFLTILSMILMITVCSGQEDDEDEWPDISGYAYLPGGGLEGLSSAKEKKVTVSPGQKFYLRGVFGSMYGSSNYRAITSNQDCLIIIDFQKFKFGLLRLFLNDTFITYSNTINIAAGDVLVFEADPRGGFSLSSDYDYMFRFTVEEPCKLGHNFNNWIVTSTAYPATSAQTCRWCHTTTGASRTTQVGDRGPAGGIIIYISTEGFDFFTGTDETKITANYIEAAPANQGTQLRWSSASGLTISNVANATDIGTGKRNTALILETDPAAPAALACKNYNGGNKNDWFLPSRDELNELYKERSHLGIRSGLFWSSSRYTNSHARNIDFANGTIDDLRTMSRTDNVRAIRVF